MEKSWIQDILDKLSNLGEWTSLADVTLDVTLIETNYYNGDENSEDKVVLENEKIQKKIKEENVILLHDPDSGEFIAKSADELSDNEWQILVERYKEEVESDNSMWMTLPEEASYLGEYSVFIQQEEELEVTNYLPKKYRSLIQLARYIHKLYEEGERKAAEQKRIEAHHQYGSDGTQLINLYSADYLIPFLSTFEEKIEEDDTNTEKREKAEEMMENILNLPIYFVHSHTDEKDLIADVNNAISQREPMIAIHGMNEDCMAKVARIYSQSVNHAEHHEYKTNFGDEKRYGGTRELKIAYNHPNNQIDL